MAEQEQPTSRNGRYTGDAPAETAVDDPAPIPSAPAEVVPGFLSELATAMQGVAQRERERLAALVADDAAVHIERARADGTGEAEGFRRMADDDVARIEQWADGEVERIRADAARRIAERRAGLDATLVQHEAVIQAEIDGVERAVVDYDDRLERFVAGLADTGDPEHIARLAATLPRPPDLADVRATARAAAMSGIAERSAAGEASAEAAAVAADGDGADGAPALAPEGPAIESVGTMTAAEADHGAEPEGDDRGPVAVMDVPTADVGEPAPPEALVAAHPFGHTNSAVRLIRSVAPWTAPGGYVAEDRTEPR